MLQRSKDRNGATTNWKSESRAARVDDLAVEWICYVPASVPPLSESSRKRRPVRNAQRNTARAPTSTTRDIEISAPPSGGSGPWRRKKKATQATATAEAATIKLSVATRLRRACSGLVILIWTTVKRALDYGAL